MVRLKVQAQRRGGHGVVRFQFLMVRLKDGRQHRRRPLHEFQFLMVRLKDQSRGVGLTE